MNRTLELEKLKAIYLTEQTNLKKQITSLQIESEKLDWALKTLEGQLNNALKEERLAIETRKLEKHNQLSSENEVRYQRIIENKKPPLVSISIPTYNGYDYIANCSIPSILLQDYQNYEVFIVNEGDDPRVENFILRLNDSRFKYISYPKRTYESVKNQWAVGGAQGQNIFLEKATGDFFAELDQDDMWNHTFLSSRVKFMLLNPEIDFTHSYSIGSNSKFVHGAKYSGNQEVNDIGHQTVFYRSKLRNYRFVESGIAPADFERWKEMYKDKVNMHFIAKVDVLYNEKKDSFDELRRLYELYFGKKLSQLK